MKTDCFVCKNYTDNSNCSVCGNKKKICLLQRGLVYD